MGRPAGYGQVGGGQFIIDIPFAANTSIRNDSGKFVVRVASNAGLMGIGSITDIQGWCVAGGTFSCSSSNGDMLPVNTDWSGVYEMPILPANSSYTETQLKARMGRTCDINLSEGIQYADLDTCTYAQIQIVGYKYYGAALGEQTVYARLCYGAVDGSGTKTFTAST